MAEFAKIFKKLSAPTRGPWIEIDVIGDIEKGVKVGPHTGAVD